MVDECAALDASFGALAEAAEILTPYGTAFRYPGDASEPQAAEACETVACAGGVLDHVHRALAKCP